MRSETLETVFFAMALAVAMVLSYIEALLPFSIGIPGAKLGLANVVTVLILFSYGAGPAALLNALRILLSGFLFGNIFSIVYSLGGFILSFFVMVMLKKSKLFGVVGVSCAGGVSHNLGQLIVAGLVLDRYVYTYLPVLIVAGVISGALIGIVSGLMLRYLERILP